MKHSRASLQAATEVKGKRLLSPFFCSESSSVRILAVLWSWRCGSERHPVKIHFYSLTLSLFVVGIMEDPHTRYSKRLVSSSDEPVAKGSFSRLFDVYNSRQSASCPKRVPVPFGVLTGGSQPVYNRVCQREPLFSRSPPVVFGFMSRPAKVNELIQRVQRKVKFTVGLFPLYWDSASSPSTLVTFARTKLSVGQFLTFAVKRSTCSDTPGVNPCVIRVVIPSVDDVVIPGAICLLHLHLIVPTNRYLTTNYCHLMTR